MRRQPQDANTTFIGQKQRWFLLRLVSSEKSVCLDNSKSPEFDYWRWVSPQVTLDEVVDFKRDVYQQALQELIPLMEGQISTSDG
jgi:putative (di)nucleoside polyphosphate hydrolase